MSVKCVRQGVLLQREPLGRWPERREPFAGFLAATLLSVAIWVAIGAMLWWLVG